MRGSGHQGNNWGELARQTASFNGAPLVDITYHAPGFERDPLGRIVRKTETILGVTKVYEYRYDALRRLDQVKIDGVVDEEFTYDANGNRLTAFKAGQGTISATYDDQDRLLTYGTWTFTYTANGELETKTNTATSETWLFQYDALGNLVSVGLPNGDLVEYLVDGMGRRVGKKKNGVLLQQWIYRNALKPVAELDGAGTLVSQFAYGSRRNTPDYVSRDGSTYRVVTDHLGSVRYVVNVANSQEVSLSAEFSAFGGVSGTGLNWVPFGFAGGLFDQDTGLMRFGLRDYDPQIGRWISKEPLRFRAARNFWVYAFNDPLNFLDPTGREPDGAGGATGTGEGGTEGAGGIPGSRRRPQPGIPFPMPFGPSRDEHANRNQNNRCPSSPPTMCGGGVEDDFEYDELFNKWRGAAGNECAYDDAGNPLSDPHQTYNFEPNVADPDHWWDDAGAHYWYGGEDGYTPNWTPWY